MERRSKYSPEVKERARLKELERENRELKRANEIPLQSIGVFRPGGARPRPK